MLFNLWNRPILEKRRILMEQLEERIVLDGSVDAVMTGIDALDAASRACPCSSSDSHWNSALEGPAGFRQIAPDNGAETFHGIYLTNDETFRGVFPRLFGSGIGPDFGSPLDGDDHSREVLIVSKLPEDHTVYMLFNAANFGPNKLYSASDFPDWTKEIQKNPDGLLFSHNLPANGAGNLKLSFARTSGQVDDPAVGPVIGVNFSLDIQPSAAGCGADQAELALHAHWSYNDSWHDTYDISLVNGFNFPIKIDTPYPDKTDPYTPDHPISLLHTIQATTKLGNSKNPGVFGLGNDQCCASCKPPSDCCGDSADFAAEAHPTLNGVPTACSGGKDYAPCPQVKPPIPVGTQCVPRPYCQFDGLHSEALSGQKTFTVTFGV
jgi:hypothetical protein